MANLKSKTLFFITSPRTPLKMVPEIKLLIENFTGEKWNIATQKKFMLELAKDSSFEGNGCPKDLAFSARDRINRGPKALGFVNLAPAIAISNAGKMFLDEETVEETLLRQLLKFQLPSPYHMETRQLSGIFAVKPFLEIFRLIYTLKRVTFDEIMIFGMQLTHYDKFPKIVEKILKFRSDRKNSSQNYKIFMGKYFVAEIGKIYEDEISKGKTRTRESNDVTVGKFIKTKANNLRDYTDACFRYLIATGLVSISQKGKSLSIVPEKIEDVKYFLDTIDKQPVYVDDEDKYKKYLFNESLPVLYTDDRKILEQKIAKYNISDFKNLSVVELKKILRKNTIERKHSILKEQIKRIKSYDEYVDIVKTFDDIRNKRFYDVPLMLEWNTWRAMTMLDGGDIHANLKFDDNGQPMSTAAGNMADIVCDYGDFLLTVEVTMQSGQRQYEMEGEPVSRHLAKIKKERAKDAFCFFIAPKVNSACIAHFYMLHLTNISFYGGKSVILPLELKIFEKMLEQTEKAKYQPTSLQVKRLCEYSLKIAQNAKSEVEWYNKVKEKALNWLSA